MFADGTNLDTEINAECGMYYHLLFECKLKPYLTCVCPANSEIVAFDGM